MDRPISFASKCRKDKVSRIKRFIYGLKQSSRVWYFGLHKATISLGLNIVSEDHCVYFKKITKGIMFLNLYVDNILLAENNMEMIQTNK